MAQLIKPENDFLNRLAFKGLQENRIEFDVPYLDALTGQRVQKGMDLPFTLENNLKKRSFLHTNDPNKDEHQRSYHFMPLTFQEFFAAKHFIRH